MLAGLDGIKNKIEPAEPIDKDIYELPPDEMAEIDQVPTSLDAVLDALEADHDFLTEGNVFTPDLIETWIDYKRTDEIAPVQLRPHPHEFELYYDIEASQPSDLRWSRSQGPRGHSGDTAPSSHRAGRAAGRPTRSRLGPGFRRRASGGCTCAT